MLAIGSSPAIDIKIKNSLDFLFSSLRNHSQLHIRLVAAAPVKHATLQQVTLPGPQQPYLASSRVELQKSRYSSHELFEQLEISLSSPEGHDYPLVGGGEGYDHSTVSRLHGHSAVTHQVLH